MKRYRSVVLDSDSDTAVEEEYSFAEEPEETDIPADIDDGFDDEAAEITEDETI